MKTTIVLHDVYCDENIYTAAIDITTTLHRLSVLK